MHNVIRSAENERENETSNQESHPPMLLGPQLSSEPETAEIPEPGEPQAPEENPNTAPRRSSCVQNSPEHYGL